MITHLELLDLMMKIILCQQKIIETFSHHSKTEKSVCKVLTSNFFCFFVMKSWKLVCFQSLFYSEKLQVYCK